jgi:DNA-directed RNA polymerase subunit omega
MIKPSLDVLMKKVDSRYTLVVTAAKRARLLMEGAQRLSTSKSDKPVTIALEEIGLGKIRYERTKEGIK